MIEIAGDSSTTEASGESSPDTGDPFSSVGRYYDRLVARYGHDFRACDYGTAASQRVKFEVLSQVGLFHGKTVLDVGCGFGDFGEFLNERFRDVAYTGIDLSHEMVCAARAAHPGFDIRNGNIMDGTVGAFDIVLANGIFYLLGVRAWPLMQDLIRRMFVSAREAIAFNSLSNLAPHQEHSEFYAAPDVVLNFCQSLSPRVVLRHDYHDRDFSVFVYKSG